MKAPRHLYRPKDALLAGVCAEAAQRLGWNVWALRALGIAGLLVQPLAAGAAYLVAALLMGLFLGNGAEEGREAPGGLASERLAERGQRIQELEEKFRTLERDGR